MTTVEELLKNTPLINSERQYVSVDLKTRVMNVPTDYRMLGVESDNESKRVYFKFPRYICDGVDLSKAKIYINYVNASQESNAYMVEDATVEKDKVIFSWLLSKSVTRSSGTVNYAVSAQSTDGVWWRTQMSSGQILSGLNTFPDVESDNPDIIEQILSKLDMTEEVVEKKPGQVLTVSTDGSDSYETPSVMPISKKLGCVISNTETKIEFYPDDEGVLFIMDNKRSDSTVISVWYKNPDKIINNLVQSGPLTIDVSKSSIIGIKYLKDSVRIGVTSLLDGFGVFMCRSYVYSLNENTWSEDIPPTSENINEPEKPKESNYKKINMSADDKLVELDSGVLYVFPEISSLSYSLKPVEKNEVGEYHFLFKSGTIMPTKLEHPSEVILPDNFEIEADRVYEIKIVEGYLSYNSW